MQLVLLRTFMHILCTLCCTVANILRMLNLQMYNELLIQHLGLGITDLVSTQ